MPSSRRTFLAGTAALVAGTALARDYGPGAQPTRYPDPDIVSLDPRFKKYALGNTPIHRLYHNPQMLWAEGPAWNGVGRYLLWSDIPNNIQRRWLEEDGHVSVFRNPANNSNGNTFDNQGRQIACEHGTRSVVRFEHDGSTTVLADRFDAKRFNSPNDVVVASDDSVWFTDPTYGIDSFDEGYPSESEIGGCHVYRIDASSGDAANGSVTAEITDMVRPNGLAFSIDERSLYVADTGASHVVDGPRHIRRYDVDLAAGAVTGGGELFATCPVGAFDGFRIDVDGRLWASGHLGVHCYHPDGTLLGTIRLGETCANVEFGGVDRRTLFMTATTSLYAVEVAVAGFR